MRLALDFRALQVGHQFRGIGEVVRQACDQLDRRLPADDEIVALVDPDGPRLDDVVAGLFGSGRPVRIVEFPNPARPRATKLVSALSPEREALLRSHADALVQFDFMLGVPAGFPSIVVMYDQVPLLLGDRYPTNYRPTYRAARRAGLPVRASLYKAGARRVYERHLTWALQNAASIIAISEHTARTTATFGAEHGVADVAERTRVAYLGHTPPPDGTPPPLNAMERTRLDGLGLVDAPFVFFMGGSDERRRVDHLVAAFNDLRGRGRELKLVLAGYDFVTVERVLSDATRQALESSSYAEDIHLLGFVTDAQRAWLYDHAEAYVFPSEHEGFGLPVIESLAVGCPVVAYDNTSISEVAGPNCLLVSGHWEDLARGIDGALSRSPERKAADADAGRAWAATFTWDTIGETLAAAVNDARR